jgi:hypothetical protein
VLVTAPFLAVARASAAARGMTDLPIVVFPAEIEDMAPDAVSTAFTARWPEIRAGLERA